MFEQLIASSAATAFRGRPFSFVLAFILHAKANLIYQVKPSYPPLAKQARIQGPVLLAAVIAPDGGIEDLRVISGHPLLISAAVDAVKQWRYRPMQLNGQPTWVDTTITVSFSQTDLPPALEQKKPCNQFDALCLWSHAQRMPPAYFSGSATPSAVRISF